MAMDGSMNWWHCGDMMTWNLGGRGQGGNEEI